MIRMARVLLTIGCCAVTMLAAIPLCRAATYQDFEPGNGSDEYAWPFPGTSVQFASGSEPHFGSRSWRTASASFWNGTGVQSQVQRWDFNMDPEHNDRLTFWVYGQPASAPDVQPDNGVGVKWFDHGTYHADGFQVWTTKTARHSLWTQLTVLFSQLPEEFDLRHVDKLEFQNYWPGVYYVDQIEAVRDDRVYQAFEPELRYGSTASEYGWEWNEADSVGFSNGDEPVHEGQHSWKLLSTQRWGGTGIQSQEQKLADGAQTFWHVDLNPAFNDRLTFWVYAVPLNGLDNNVAVQFYDHDQHVTDDTKAVVWTTHAVRAGHWTRLTVPFSALPLTLNLHDLNKLQFQCYWPGTYYLDDIRATGPSPVINKTQLLLGTLEWAPTPDTGVYEVTESPSGPDGPWTIYWLSDPFLPQTSVQVTRLTKAWYRVNASDPVAYEPPLIVLASEELDAGSVVWRTIPQTDQYEVQAAPERSGPWATIYRGPSRRLPAHRGEWYRARAVRQASDGAVTDTTSWGPAIAAYASDRGFVEARGTVLREDNGRGDVLVLRGVNLGGFLVLEPWMTGIGAADTPEIPDEWTMRDVLAQRFGESATQQLLATYRDAYFQDFDADTIWRMGMNVVRLPFWYRTLQDENGEWLRTADGKIDFSALDRAVKLCADRGLYVLLDLHGAPGGQSAEAHTGRQGFNRLFAATPEGALYRARTVTLWKELAKHYKNTQAIAGYDLLNEPVGAPTPAVLWDLYHDIYRAIRGTDGRHLIVMEGIWDWTTLPPPSSMDWRNVAYEFHYYLFEHGEDVAAHQAFLDAQVAQGEVKQREYQVPAIIGEFTGFSLKAIWEAYLEAFNAHGWSWMPWTYKFRNAPSDWGLVTHADYDDALPRLRAVEADGSSGDAYEVLAAKSATYDTLTHHASNHTLMELLSRHIVPVAEASLTITGLTAAPDPFSPRRGQTTTIRFTLSGPASVTARIYDESGRAIRTLLLDAAMPPGEQQVAWDGRKQGGGFAKPGMVYTYNLWALGPDGHEAVPYPASGSVVVVK